MKKFKRLKTEVYDIVEANLDKTLDLLIDTQSPYLTLQTIAEVDNPFEESAIYYTDLSFKTDSQKAINDDFENAKMIYESLDISPQQATDKYFWAGLAFSEAHHYLKHRWGLSNSKDLMYRWITHTNTRRGLFYNGLSRLWWYYKLTYNKDLDDQELFTKMAFSKSEAIANLLYRNISSSQNVRMAYMKYVYKLNINNSTNIRFKLREAVKELSLLGGTLVLDSLTEIEIYNYLQNLPSNWMPNNKL